MDTLHTSFYWISTLLPGNDLIFHTTASLSGAYVAYPIDVRMMGLIASDGTGNSISTFVAVLPYTLASSVEIFPWENLQLVWYLITIDKNTTFAL